MLFFNIDFFWFWSRFWNLLDLQLGAKSAALLAAPGVLDPTACFACLNILHVLPSGRPTTSKMEPRTDVCWAHVGTFFALGSLFFALGRFLSASCTFETRVGRFLRACGRCGLDFGWSGQGFGAFPTTFVNDF